MASAGRILIMPKGAYDASATYEMLDLVNHNGKSWLAKKTVNGIEPSDANSEHWQDMFKITAENAGAVQNTIWKWTPAGGDTLYSYINSKFSEGYTSGLVQVEAINSFPADIPDFVKSNVGTHFMCSFQKHYFDYVKILVWGDSSSYEYSGRGFMPDGALSALWVERACPEGFVRNSGGTLTGDTTIEKPIPQFALRASTTRATIIHKNATEDLDHGTAIIDRSDDVRTLLVIQNGQLKLFKQINGVEVGSKVIAEIPD